MVIIAADTHVHETGDIWSFLAENEQGYRPAAGFPKQFDPSRRPTR